MPNLQSLKETEQREFEKFIEKQSQELSECVDVMPEHVGALKMRAYNIMLDLGYVSKNWLKEHDLRLEKAIREYEREKVVETVNSKQTYRYNNDDLKRKEFELILIKKDDLLSSIKVECTCPQTNGNHDGYCLKGEH